MWVGVHHVGCDKMLNPLSLVCFIGYSVESVLPRIEIFLELLRSLSVLLIDNHTGQNCKFYSEPISLPP